MRRLVLLQRQGCLLVQLVMRLRRLREGIQLVTVRLVGLLLHLVRHAAVPPVLVPRWRARVQVTVPRSARVRRRVDLGRGVGRACVLRHWLRRIYRVNVIRTVGSVVETRALVWRGGRGSRGHCTSCRGKVVGAETCATAEAESVAAALEERFHAATATQMCRVGVMHRGTGGRCVAGRLDLLRISRLSRVAHPGLLLLLLQAVRHGARNCAHLRLVAREKRRRALAERDRMLHPLLRLLLEVRLDHVQLDVLPASLVLERGQLDAVSKVAREL